MTWQRRLRYWWVRYFTKNGRYISYVDYGDLGGGKYVALFDYSKGGDIVYIVKSTGPHVGYGVKAGRVRPVSALEMCEMYWLWEKYNAEGK